MIVTYIMLGILAVLTLAVFYLIIRLKDIRSNTDSLCAKFPISDEMRKQASETISSLNERMTVLNQKAREISDVMNEVRR